MHLQLIKQLLSRPYLTEEGITYNYITSTSDPKEFAAGDQGQT